MGLDNGVICRVSSEKYNFKIEYEVCYWRKYWNLRDDIFKAIDTTSEYNINLTENMINDLYDVFDYYEQDIRRIKEREGLSTIWSFTDEYKNMLHSRDNFFCIKGLLNGNMTLQEFIDITYEKNSCFAYTGLDDDVYDIIADFQDKPKEEGDIFICGDDSDIKISFEFYDSY